MRRKTYPLPGKRMSQKTCWRVKWYSTNYISWQPPSFVLYNEHEQRNAANIRHKALWLPSLGIAKSQKSNRIFYFRFGLGLPKTNDLGANRVERAGNPATIAVSHCDLSWVEIFQRLDFEQWSKCLKLVGLQRFCKNVCNLFFCWTMDNVKYLTFREFLNEKIFNINMFTTPMQCRVASDFYRALIVFMDDNWTFKGYP